jgi:hypothetical protein
LPHWARIRLRMQLVPPLYEIKPLPDDPTKGELQFNLHAGQARAYDSRKRFVLVCAGAQSGKTAFGPVWLYSEILKRGPGDYLVVTPTDPLLVKKALPEFLRLFKVNLKLGDYQTQQKIFTFSQAKNIAMFGGAGLETPTQIFFGHASDPDSLESATAKAAWLDEAGMKNFRLGSWEAIMRRLSIHQGRVLITTTPYSSTGWLKQTLWDPWNESKGTHALIDVVRFDSTENPAFPREEFERAQETLPRWRFDLFYRGVFSRPAGLIYGSFDEHKHKIPRINIPPEWPRFLGLDFGGVNTAGIFLAEERVGAKPTGRLIAYREYMAGERSAAQHCYHLMKGEPRIPLCAGGSTSEGQWRMEFHAGGTAKDERGNHVRVHGLPIHGPDQSDVEVGINRVYKAFALGQLLVFEDLHGFLDELQNYSRELNEMGEATEKIDAIETFHFVDALRYIIGYLKPDKPKSTMNKSPIAFRGLQNL